MNKVMDLAMEASKQGWLSFKASGSVIEISFPGVVNGGLGRNLSMSRIDVLKAELPTHLWLTVGPQRLRIHSGCGLSVYDKEDERKLRLVAAQELQNKLKLILTGEPPYDIFVRWKPIEEQPIGWNPDLNDGVRMNIRPFMTAEVLRKKPTINWSKDRGSEPVRESGALSVVLEKRQIHRRPHQ